jgi:hypothetical protein
MQGKMVHLYQISPVKIRDIALSCKEVKNRKKVLALREMVVWVIFGLKLSGDGILQERDKKNSLRRMEDK